MKEISNILNYLWPTARMADAVVLDNLQQMTTDLDNITAADWGTQQEAFLEEARRLRDAETARRDSADTKAQIYLGILFVIVPMLISIPKESGLSGLLNFDTWLNSSIYLLFLLSIAFGIGVFSNSIQALRVSVFNRVGEKDLVLLAREGDPLGALIRDVLKSVRRDRDGNNLKVSYVANAHQFFIRMVAAISLAFLVSGLIPVVALVDSFLSPVATQQPE